MRAKSSVCESCGTREDEWEEGGRFAFIAETRRCSGCELLEMEHENVAADEKGIKYFLMKNPNKDDE